MGHSEGGRDTIVDGAEAAELLLEDVLSREAFEAATFLSLKQGEATANMLVMFMKCNDNGEPEPLRLQTCFLDILTLSLLR